jgi:hypothetical protein
MIPVEPNTDCASFNEPLFMASLLLYQPFVRPKHALASSTNWGIQIIALTLQNISRTNIDRSMSSLESTKADRSQQISPTPLPVLQTTQQVTETPVHVHEVHYLEETVQQDANLQVLWTNWMSDVQKPSFYKAVSVLLLSWHPECDDMAVGDEVSRLALYCGRNN